MDYPLPMHRNTWDASLAAACANDQGKFWEMHDVIFANQDRWNGESDEPAAPVHGRSGEGRRARHGRSTTRAWTADTHRAKVQSHLQEAERAA
jgi:protein-disulfide isomerase